MAPIKQQFKEINWLKIGLEVIALGLIIGGGLLSLGLAAGDGRWANKKLVENDLANLDQRLIKNEILDHAHYDKDMTPAEEMATFATIDALSRIKEDTNDELRELKQSQAEFWKEQRAVNREILSKLD